jgi:hypothetical protein
MRTQIRLTAAALILIVAVAVAQTAAPALSVRLVTASKDAGSPDARLRDVQTLLESNSNLKSFRLDGEASLSFKEGASATLAKGYRLELSQVQNNNAMVRVSRNQVDVVQTRLALREGSPVVFGFDDPPGARTIIVLRLK